MTDTVEPIAEPLADSIPVAAARLGISRALLYVCLKRREILAKKAKGRTLITREEQARWLASLPDAYAPKSAA